jgi:hypothetical protein
MMGLDMTMMRRMIGVLVLAAALLVGGGTDAQTRCENRSGGTLVVCWEIGGGPPQRYLTRPAVGGGTITTGGGRVCWTRPAVGGGSITTCR